MSQDDRQRWERKHRTHQSGAPLTTMAWIPAAASARAVALDVACGTGRHIAALSGAGYRVVAADVAVAALAEATARPSAAPVWPVQVDLDDWAFATSAFDLVIQCDYLDRRLFDCLRRSVRAGGYVLVDTFRRGPARAAAGPRNPAYALEDGELEHRFADWQILRRETYESPTMRAAILARKPAVAGLRRRRQL